MNAKFSSYKQVTTPTVKFLDNRAVAPFSPRARAIRTAVATLLCLVVLGPTLASTALAHGQLHAKACAGAESDEYWCDDKFRNHVAGQDVVADIYYIGGWGGDAGAYVHVWSPSANSWSYYKWRYVSCTCCDCGYAKTHAGHHPPSAVALHEALDEAPADGTTQLKAPPEEAETTGQFGLSALTITQEEKVMAFDFGQDPAARLQVDARNLRPGDEASSSFTLNVNGLEGKLLLRVRDGRATLSASGLFENVRLRVEQSPTGDNLFLVRLNSALNFQMPGLVEEAAIEADLDGEHIIAPSNCVPVAITSQPRSVTHDVCAADGVTFTVNGTGTGPLKFQWYFNGAAIPNATSATYAIDPVTPSDAGSYAVKVSNPCGSAMSDAAILTVLKDTTPPVIICPPNITTEAQFADGAVVRWEVLARDNCDPAVTVQCDLPSGSEFDIGTTRVTCEAVDASGNQARCSFTVTVTGQPPLRLDKAGSTRDPNLLLRWTGDRVLQTTDSLTPPAFWRNVADAPDVRDDERVLPLPKTGPKGFFRLATRRPWIPEVPAGFDDSNFDLLPEHIAIPALPNPFPIWSPTYHIRIHGIATADNDGSHAATITAAGLVTKVSGLNAFYAPMGIQFDFDPATNFETINSTLLNRDWDLLIDPADYTNPNSPPPDTGVDDKPHTAARIQEARQHRGKLVIYFRHGDKWVFDAALGHWKLSNATGASSSWAGEYVRMTRGGGAAVDLAHETGHYLQNRHPFVGSIATVSDAADAIKKYVEDYGYPKSEGLNALDGDKVFVLDTAPDAKGSIFENANLDPCGPVDHIDIPVNFSDNTSKTYVLKPDRGNIMSYFKGCTEFAHYFSDDQAARTRDGLENGLRHSLISRKADDLAVQITRQGDVSDIAASEISVVRTGFRQFVTALRDGDGNLRLIAWRASSDTQIVRQGEASAGAVSKVSACSLGLGLVSTAVRDTSGNLKVIVWKVTSGGQITRQGDDSAGAVSEIASCRLGIEALATAVRDGDGHLQVILWHVTADGQITRKDDASAGAISQVAICPAGSHRVATAVRTASGSLKVILWEATAEGEDVVRLGSGVAGAISHVDSFNLDRDLLATSVRDGSGDLKVIAWQITDDGEVIRRDDAVGPLITRAASCRLGVDMLATAVRSDIGNLRVLAWKVTSNGSAVTLLDESVPGAAGYVSEVSTCRVGLGSIVTAVRDNGGALKVILWEIAP